MSRQVKKIEFTKTEKKALLKRIRLTKDRKTADKFRKKKGSHLKVVMLNSKIPKKI
jgi:hypothetical protein